VTKDSKKKRRKAHQALLGIKIKRKRRNSQTKLLYPSNSISQLEQAREEAKSYVETRSFKIT
jgi:hypothetical protein